MPARDYQLEALGNVKQAWSDGINKQLIVLPTGTGKTEIFARKSRWKKPSIAPNQTPI